MMRNVRNQMNAEGLMLITICYEEYSHTK